MMPRPAGTTKTLYTEGPWEYRPPREDGAVEVLHDEEVVAIVQAAPKGDIDANAELISASPDLLEALRLLLPYVEEQAQELLDEGDTETYMHCQQDIQRARAAIHKATGEGV